MSQPKLLVLKGLPASGKSTKAKALAEQGFVRTNKDTIRKDLFGTEYRRKDEKKVVRERDRQVTEALSQGKDVVVDDTNLNPIHIKELFAIAREHNAIFEVDDSFLDVSLTECIERDSKRGDDMVGEQVIRRMYHEFVRKPQGYVPYDPELPMCVISDLDGTLAHMNGKRKPFDWHKVGLDIIDDGVAHTLDAVNYMGYAKIFLFSGRSDICRPETEEWLERHDIEYEALYMKPHARVQEDDRICKREFLETYILGKYNVLYILDDRPKVCRMWRDEYGLRVMQLGDPHWEF